MMNWKLPVSFADEILSKSGVESSELDGVGRNVDSEFWTSEAERSVKELVEALQPDGSCKSIS